MGPENVVFLIPIVAIVLGIGAGIIKTVLGTFERIQMAKLEAARTNVRAIDDGNENLRDEIAKLRDTSTQHAISLQHSVERLEQRVDFLEKKVLAATTSVDRSVEPAPLQIVGRS